MRYVVAVLCAFALAALTVPRAGAEPIDFSKYDKNANKRIDIGPESDVILMHQRNPVLANCDTNYDGRLDTAKEIACANAFFSASIKRARIDVKDADPERKGLTYEQAKAAFGTTKKEDEVHLPFFVRDAYTPSSVNKKLTPQNMVGARVSYTRLIDTNEDVFSLTGAVLYPIDLGVGKKDITDRQPTLAELTILPGVEFNRVTRSKTASKEVNYLGFLVGGEANLNYFPIFPTQYVRATGYYKTDFNGDTQIPGGFVEWQPVFLSYGIGGPHGILGTPINYMISPVAHVEAEHVSRAGTAVGVMTGNDYFRAGGVIEAKLWFDSGPLDRVSLHAKYWRLWDLAGVPESDREYFQADGLYNLDPKGHFAVDLRYRRGDEPALGIPVHDFTAGLSVKY